MEQHQYEFGHRMSRLYTEAKRTYQSVAQAFSQPEDAPEIAALHRKSRMQKDRLIAWGLDWQDRNAQGLIDESIKKAGLEEIVTSCLENIKNTIDEMDALATRASRPSASTTATGFPMEKSSKTWSPQARKEYEDLVEALTSTINLLCDLSQQHRPQTPPGLAGYPQDKKVNPYPEDKKVNPYVDEKQALKAKDFPQFPASAQPHQHGLASIDTFKLNRNDLILPEEPPPPFEDEAPPDLVRIVGRMKLRSSSNTVPVLVEYIDYDRIFIETDVPLPYLRVEEFAALCGGQNGQAALPKLLGFFEDRPRPRVGFVYELPQHAPTDMPNSMMKPSSLCELLRAVSKQQNYVVPALEDRFRMALDLISGMSFLLNMGFPHKILNSASVFFFPTPNTGRGTSTTPSLNFDIRKPSLSGVDFFSEFSIDTEPENLFHNIYRHPEDPRVKGPSSKAPYQPWLDLYSLGLILLEIGLWMPLQDLYKEKYSLPDFQVRVERIWVRKLSGKCGTAYMRAVQILLAADENSYIQSLERAMAKLSLCCALDDEDDTEYPITTHRLTSEPEQFIAETPELAFAAARSEFTSPAPAAVRDREVWDAATPTKAPRTAAPGEKVSPNCILADKLQSFGAQLTSYDVRESYNQLMTRVSPFVNKVLSSKADDSFLICLDMLGNNESSAKPYIHICCNNTKLVYAAFQKFFRVDKETDLGIAISKGETQYSKAAANTPAAESFYTSGLSSDTPAKNPDFYERPSCGASVGAWKDEEHLPPVSFGGVILVDGKPFGMTVHHSVEVPASETNPPPPALPANELTEDDDLADALEGMDLDDDLLQDLADIGSGFVPPEEPDPTDVGDTPGFTRGSGKDILITQPALDDMPTGYYPSEEDQDEEHLMSHEFGAVYASSGLRRTHHGGKNHEIDWMLLELKDSRIQPGNVVPGSRLYCASSSTHGNPPQVLRRPIGRPTTFSPDEDGYPTTIMPHKLMPGRPVHSFGRTSGLASGCVSPVMGTTKFKGRSTSADVWLVEGNFGQPGDSGAWVFDNEAGRVCGYVLGRNTRLRAAVIAPMEIVFEDIRQTLGAQTISLPGAIAEETHAGSLEVAANVCVKVNNTSGGRFTEPQASALLAGRHFLLSGAPGHLEREWAARRSALGQMASS